MARSFHTDLHPTHLEHWPYLIEGRVSIRLALEAEPGGARFATGLGAFSRDDVETEVLALRGAPVYDDPEMARRATGAAGRVLREWFYQAVRRGPLADQLRVPLDLGLFRTSPDWDDGSVAAQPVAFFDRAGRGRALALAAFEMDVDGEPRAGTAGEAADVPDFLGEHETVTVRLSEDAFARAWDNAVGEVFLSDIAVQVTDAEHVERSVTVSALTGGEVTISGVPSDTTARDELNGRRAGVLTRVRNLRTRERRDIAVAADGQFSQTLPAERGTPLPGRRAGARGRHGRQRPPLAAEGRAHPARDGVPHPGRLGRGMGRLGRGRPGRLHGAGPVLHGWGPVGAHRPRNRPDRAPRRGEHGHVRLVGLPPLLAADRARRGLRLRRRLDASPPVEPRAAHHWPLAERGVRILGSLGPTIPAGAEPRDGADEWRAALRLELSGLYSSFGETRGVGGASRAEAREPLTPVWTVTSDPPGFARLDSVHRDGSGVFRATLVADTRSLPAYTLRVDVRVELEDIFGARAVDAVRFDAWPLRDRSRRFERPPYEPRSPRLPREPVERLPATEADLAIQALAKVVSARLVREESSGDRGRGRGRGGGRFGIEGFMDEAVATSRETSADTRSRTRS